MNSPNEASAKQNNADAVDAPAPNRSPRRRARELAVQGLYQWRVGGQDEAAIEAHLMDNEELRDEFKRADRKLFETLLRGALAQAEALFAALAPHVDRKLDEMSPIESSILLLASYELTHHPETPYRVIINEAIELAKTFGGTDGHKYVNGVLDKLALKVRAAEVAANQTRRGKA
jgi:transcription antitermination protein NusB